MNSHFISRFLTEPWELPGSQSGLLHFDLVTGKIRTGKARRLLAREGLHDEKIEGRLSDLIEAPVGRFRKELLVRETGGRSQETIEIDRWEVFRGLFLLLAFQGARSAIGLRPGTSKEALNGLLLASEPTLNTVFMPEMKNSRMVVFWTEPGHRLFFPSTGIFAVPLRTDTGFCFGLAMPLAPTVCLAMGPANAHPKLFRDSKDLVIRSVGTNEEATKVLIPPDFSGRDRNELGGSIRTMRATALECLAHEIRIKKLEESIFARAGLRPPPSLPLAG